MQAIATDDQPSRASPKTANRRNTMTLVNFRLPKPFLKPNPNLNRQTHYQAVTLFMSANLIQRNRQPLIAYTYLTNLMPVLLLSFL